MRRDTKKEAKSIGDSFKAIGSAWKSVIAGLTTGALAGAVISELKSTEKAVASFISATPEKERYSGHFSRTQDVQSDRLRYRPKSGNREQSIHGNDSGQIQAA